MQQASLLRRPYASLSAASPQFARSVTATRTRTWMDEDAGIAQLAQELGVCAPALEWLRENKVEDVSTMARLAPTEELLWKHVIDDMKPALPAKDRVPVVLLWERCRWLTMEGCEAAEATRRSITSAHAETVTPWRLPRNLSSIDVVGDGEFWINLVSTKINLQDDSMDNMMIHSLCDLTSERVQDMFSRFDEDGDGLLTATELLQGFTSQGFLIREDDIDQIMQGLGSSSSERFSPGDVGTSPVFGILQFDVLLKLLRLAELFTEPCARKWDGQLVSTLNRIDCYDYNRFECVPFQPKQPCQAFFFSSRSARTGSHGPLSCRSRPIRWIHVDATRGLDRLLLLRLAVKYHLHPLAIDDVWNNRTATKFERHADNYFVAADILTLASARGSDRAAWHSSSSSQLPERVEIGRTHVSIILMGKMTGEYVLDTMLTIHQERPNDSSWLAMWRGTVSDRKPWAGEEAGMQATTSAPQNLTNVWCNLREDLTHEPPRRVREENADFLLYATLGHIVSQLRPIVEAYARRLGYMNQLSPAEFSEEWVREWAEVQLELADLQRSTRPMGKVVRDLIDDQHSGKAARPYFRDVKETLDSILEDISHLSKMTLSLQESHQKHSDHRMSRTLSNISITGLFFLPAQFITGVYGMNFAYANGQPSMPELTWKYGYEYFWLLQLCVFVFMVVMYNVYKLCSFRRIRNAFLAARWKLLSLVRCTGSQRNGSYTAMNV